MAQRARRAGGMPRECLIYESGKNSATPLMPSQPVQKLSAYKLHDAVEVSWSDGWWEGYVHKAGASKVVLVRLRARLLAESGLSQPLAARRLQHFPINTANPGEKMTVSSAELLRPGFVWGTAEASRGWAKVPQFSPPSAAAKTAAAKPAAKTAAVAAAAATSSSNDDDDDDETARPAKKAPAKTPIARKPSSAGAATGAAPAAPAAADGGKKRGRDPRGGGVGSAHAPAPPPLPPLLPAETVRAAVVPRSLLMRVRHALRADEDAFAALMVNCLVRVHPPALHTYRLLSVAAVASQPDWPSYNCPVGTADRPEGVSPETRRLWLAGDDTAARHAYMMSEVSDTPPNAHEVEDYVARHADQVSPVATAAAAVGGMTRVGADPRSLQLNESLAVLAIKAAEMLAAAGAF
jgi:hypothetical protein